MVNLGGVSNDGGFHNSVTRPLFQDLQLGGTDGYGNPLGLARQIAHFEKHGTPISNPAADICSVLSGGPPPNLPIYCEDDGNGNLVRNNVPYARLVVDGSSKSSTMRNIALTPPYFSYGGYATLEQVMDFYNRGGSAQNLPLGCTPLPPGPPPTPLPANACTGNTSGSGPDGDTPIADLLADPHTNRGSNRGLIIPLGLTQEESDAVVAFMKALTDPRVQCDADVFDHPELIIFHGHKGKDRNWDYAADDRRVRLPAVGKEGYSAKRPKLCLPNAGDLFAKGMGKRTRDKR